MSIFKPTFYLRNKVRTKKNTQILGQPMTEQVIVLQQLWVDEENNIKAWKDVPTVQETESDYISDPFKVIT